MTRPQVCPGRLSIPDSGTLDGLVERYGLKVFYCSFCMTSQPIEQSDGLWRLVPHHFFADRVRELTPVHFMEG